MSRTAFETLPDVEITPLEELVTGFARITGAMERVPELIGLLNVIETLGILPPKERTVITPEEAVLLGLADR